MLAPIKIDPIVVDPVTVVALAIGSGIWFTKPQADEHESRARVTSTIHDPDRVTRGYISEATCSCSSRARFTNTSTNHEHEPRVTSTSTSHEHESRATSTLCVGCGVELTAQNAAPGCGLICALCI